MMNWDMTMTVIRLEEPYDLGPIQTGPKSYQLKK